MAVPQPEKGAAGHSQAVERKQMEARARFPPTDTPSVIAASVYRSPVGVTTSLSHTHTLPCGLSDPDAPQVVAALCGGRHVAWGIQASPAGYSAGVFYFTRPKGEAG